MARRPRARAEAAAEPRAVKDGYDEIELDVERVLRENLPGFFDHIRARPLLQGEIDRLPEKAKGIYMLFLGEDDLPVYLGKTDAQHGFRDRLNRHMWSVRGRQDLDPSMIRFKAIRIMVFSALDAESILIKEMRRQRSGSLAWNNSGFGSNDTGRERDGQMPAQFDQDFKVRFDFLIEGMPDVPASARAVLKLLKTKTPYLVRYKGIPDGIEVPAFYGRQTVETIVTAVIRSLPGGFQATILHGRVIIYREDKDYPHHLRIIRS